MVAGSLWSRRLRLPADPVVALAAQPVASAAVLAVVVGATGIAGRADVADLPASAWWALACLVVASTLVGHAVFLAVNADVSPTVAHNVVRYTEMPRGGHFPFYEAPHLLIGDLRSFRACVAADRRMQ